VNASDLLRFLRRSASHNLGLKFLAVALAVACWWFVAGENKVLMAFTVPLEIRELPKGMTVTNKVERQVEVRLSGPSSLLTGLKPSEISAAIDLSGARSGRQYVTLDERAVNVPTGVKVQRIYPPSIEVILDRTERRVVPVFARIGGGQALKKKVAKVEVDPPALEIEALPEEFPRMKAVYTEEIVPDRDTGSFSASARVELREPHAKIVGSPNVRVRIQFRN